MDNLLQLGRAGRFAFGLFACLVAVFLLIPTLLVIPMSLSGSELLEFPPTTWSTRWWQEFWQSNVWMSATRVSLLLALSTALCAVPIALAAAYATRSISSRPALLLSGLVLMPVAVPPVLIGIGLFFAFAKLQLNGTFPGLLIGHTLMAMPVAFVILRAALSTFDLDQLRVARSLGANGPQSFFLVLVPQVRGQILTAALLAFLTSLDEVIISMFVGSGSNTTLTKVMFLSLRDRIDPQTAVISSVWTVLVFAIVLIVYRRELAAGAREPALLPAPVSPTPVSPTKDTDR